MVSYLSRSNGHVIKGHTAYFISDQDFKKGKDPNIHIIDGIHNIKGKTYVNVLVSNYTNKHITFNKGEYVGHLEPPIEDMQQTPEDPESPTTHSITTERMMAEKVEPDTFRPPCHKLRKDIETELVRTIKGIPISVYPWWNHHWDHTTDLDDDRYQSFWASLTETLSNSNETLQIG